ncbi:prenyltransferase [bacterium]|nr:prenyltransferase [bacterium]
MKSNGGGSRLTDIKTAFLETRPQFLLLSVTLIMVGSSVAFYCGASHIPNTILALLGLLALHASCNVLNDYHDFRTGIDLNTQRTPFSGGSGLLPTGKISSKTALNIGLISLAAGCIIGIYLIINTGWQLAPIIAIGVIAVYFYNPIFSKLMVGEILAGLGLGLLPVLGVFLVITGEIAPVAFFAGMPPFFLTFNLLFLNEFPDSEADRIGGRSHLVIFLGKEKAGVLYSIITSLVYLWIISGVIAGIFPAWTMMAILTLPFGIKAMKGALLDYEDFKRFIPAQGANVIVVLATQALFASGFLIAGISGI